MKNVYILIKNGTDDVNLIEAQTKGVNNSIYSHENFHYTSRDGVSIINGNFTEEEILWFDNQSWAYIVGNYLPGGRAEQKVLDHGLTFSKPFKPIPPPSDDSGFVRQENGQFMLGDKRFRNSFVNKYNIFTSNLSLSQVIEYLDYCEAIKIKLVRTWMFPTDFLLLVFPLAPINLLSDPSFELDDPFWVKGGAFKRSTDSVADGSWAIKQVSAYNSYDSLSRIVSVEPNKEYVWTIKHKLLHYGGSANQAPPRIVVGTEANSEAIANFGFLGNAEEYTQKQYLFNSGNRTEIKISIQNWGGKNEAFYDSFHLGLKQTPQLVPKQKALDHAKLVFDAAEERGIRFILSLADNNPNFNTKKAYVDWANIIYSAGISSSYPFIGFYQSEHCKNLYKMYFDILSDRFKNHKGIFSWETGNELRVDRFTSENGTQNTISSENITLLSKPGGWIDEMSTYFKSKDPNHMVAPPACTHKWKWVNGDSVANGSGYGIDDELVATLPNIDYISIHFYPTQGGGEIEVTKKYGQHLGFPNTINTEGLEAQVVDWIRNAKANGKGFLMDEVGFIREVIGSNQIIPLYPRKDTVRYIHDLVYNNDGDGVGWWHGETGDGGSYSINISGSFNGDTRNLNYDDRPIVEHFRELNTKLEE